MLTGTRFAAGTLAATTLLTISVAIAAADPGDYSTLPVDPNIVTDSTAYTAAVPVMNPGGQPGVATVYTHRDGARQITNTILILSDPASAATDINGKVSNGKTKPVQVGTNGRVVAGTSPDGTHSLSILQFTEGNAVTTVEFAGPANDPVPIDLVTEYGKQQDAAIKGWFPG